MSNENENPVIEEVTENVEEQPTEEVVEGEEELPTSEPVVEEVTTPEKKYTDAEVDEIFKRKIARERAKIERDFIKKYSKIETLVKTGFGAETLDEAAEKIEGVLKQKNIPIPQVPQYSERDLQVLADVEADDIISDGYEEIVKEVDRLANIGIQNMSARDKIVFKKLAEKRQEIEDEKSLSAIGVGKDILNDKEFQAFAKRLDPKLSLKEKYEVYTEYRPTKKIESMGSMRNTTDNNVKDYYTPAEVDRLTASQLRDPKIAEAVDNSMAIWYQKGIR